MFYFYYFTLKIPITVVVLPQIASNNVFILPITLSHLMQNDLVSNVTGSTVVRI